jgi:hypothetical protein
MKTNAAPKNGFRRWLILTLMVFAILGLSGVLYHTTHCDGDHGHCHICLLAATLIITIAFGITFFIHPSCLDGLINNRASYGYSDLRIAARAPPFILSRTQ